MRCYYQCVFGDKKHAFGFIYQCVLDDGRAAFGVMIDVCLVTIGMPLISI